MIYRFDRFELDRGAYSLTCEGAPVAVEPLVFDLIAFFLEEAGAVVGRDRIVEAVWNGRVVSEATISTAIKSARRALGDDGERQEFIRTVRGRGFQFAAAVESVEAAAAPIVATAPPPSEAAPTEGLHNSVGKPTIAVLPFRLLGMTDGMAGLADAIPQELILALGRLRWLFVIARGSSFRFRDPDPDIVEIGRVLGVRYCVTGIVEVFGPSISVGVELVDARSGALVWGDRFSGGFDRLPEMREELLRGVVGSLELQIPLNEALQAQRQAAEALDAWQTYHLGLKEMHLYTETGNAAAAGHFAEALKLDPNFARAHAGLALAHFQNAFMGYTTDRLAEVAAARRYADRSVELDPLDPFTNFAMGRAHWIAADWNGAGAWFDQATTLSPNYAHGHYARSYVETMLGRLPKPAQWARLAMELSPLDPLLYAMRGVEAMAHLGQGDPAEAARMATAAAASPRAHFLIDLIAVAAHELNGDAAQAAHWAAVARRKKPDATAAHFLASMDFQNDAIRAQVAKALAARDF